MLPGDCSAACCDEAGDDGIFIVSIVAVVDKPTIEKSFSWRTAYAVYASVISEGAPV